MAALAAPAERSPRRGRARDHATLAIPLLLQADPSFEADAERAARLRGLASA
jgi:hypothetical protein